MDAERIECLRPRQMRGARWESEERVTVHLPMDLGRAGRILKALGEEGFEFEEFLQPKEDRSRFTPAGHTDSVGARCQRCGLTRSSHDEGAFCRVREAT